MSNTFYDQRTGQLFKLRGGAMVPSKITYLDVNVPPSHQPKFANGEYQAQFAKFANQVLVDANRSFQVGFKVDDCRLSEFPGEGIIDGSYTMYLVRSDYAGQRSSDNQIAQFSNADYRYELRAFDSIPFFENNNENTLRDMAIRALALIANK